jgi:hypothetical protein
VQINKSQNYYDLYVVCIVNSSGRTVITSPAWKTTLRDVSFDPATNVADVFFPVLSGGTVTAGDSIVLTSIYGGNKKTISLQQGIIKISK